MTANTESELPVTPTERTTLEALEGSPHARVFEGEPQTIRLTLDAGEIVPPHQHPDRQIVLHLLEGHLSVTLGEDEHDVTAGEVVRFDGNQDVSPEALEKSTALLVLAPRADV
ncbi:cupin domain-containing protein [Halobacteria archaeon AArc-m2/3/4]|uniref:Cupin domain-containing protein n=1 Tax=Natronoglomus mannanivorans TaxID=2979990 RepID=A0AAP2Z2W6_9EURY|nr:cupin domain-containing protein [Halobacteria archaeon AArc-xg1-1]MCU4973908.1 cupin domain-containing protein [Halobacteria archaeon AArc-m2/3/4]